MCNCCGESPKCSKSGYSHQTATTVEIKFLCFLFFSKKRMLFFCSHLSIRLFSPAASWLVVCSLSNYRHNSFFFLCEGGGFLLSARTHRYYSLPMLNSFIVSDGSLFTRFPEFHLLICVGPSLLRQ